MLNNNKKVAKKLLTATDRFSRNVFPFAWFLPIAVAFHAK